MDYTLCNEPENIPECLICLRNPANAIIDDYWQSWTPPDIVEPEPGVKICRLFKPEVKNNIKPYLEIPWGE